MLTLAVGLGSAVTVIASIVESRRLQHLGPPAWPLVGNTLQAPQVGGLWRWGWSLFLHYGDIVQLRIVNDNVLILSNPADAEDLLCKRGAYYSRRPPSIYTNIRSGHKRMLLLQPGDELTRQRRAMQLMLRPEAIRSYFGRQEEQALGLAYDLLHLTVGPIGGYRKAIKRYACGVVMGIAYGRTIAGDERDLAAIMASNATLNDDAVPFSHLVDFFPWLDYLPNFLSPWRTEAQKKHEEEAALFGRLAQAVKKHMPQCFVADLWTKQAELGLDDLSVAYLGGTAFEAGTQTTAGTVHCFMVIWLQRPDLIQIVQAEMDTVLGGHGYGTMPVLEDMPRLPALNALVKETLRWFPVTPLAFPHVAEKDDEWKGLQIKKGTLVMPSIWNMHHNNDGVFPHGDTFDPSRFYQSDANDMTKDPSLVDGHWSFGFGRRACPARYLAANSVWIALARMIWAFDVTRAPGAERMSFNIDDVKWIVGVNIEPEPLPVRFVPRSNWHAETIRQEWKKTLAMHV